MRRAPFALALLASALADGAPASARANPVLLISIDGLRPGDVLEARQRGLKLPNLTRFVAEGAHATGVVGNLPTVTYPSHTTLMTGVAPARHGIVNNTTFDPLQINQAGWYWYAEDEKARTLWDVAHDAGLTTANVHWPVSVGARSVTWNLPQIWRTGHADDRKLFHALATPGLVATLEHDCGEPYADGIAEALHSDQTRAKFAVDLIGRYKPGFVTVYLASLDHEEHMSGPGSAQAHATLEALDALVGQLVAAEQAAHPDATVALVSDHGFAPTDTIVNFYRPFLDAGLITLDDKGKIKSWEASPWPSGGSAAIMLARPDDAALKARVAELLARLKADPAAHIAEVIDAAGIARAGANPQASFYVNLALGAASGPFVAADTPLSFPAPVKGMHGYFPAAQEMRSTFLAMGKGVKPGLNLGEVDMRAIAPTLAKLMGGTLPDAEAPALDLGK